LKILIQLNDFNCVNQDARNETKGLSLIEDKEILNSNLPLFLFIIFPFQGFLIILKSLGKSIFFGGFVPIYILLSTLTSEGRKTIKERPERILEVNKEIEVFGAKVLEQYAVLGKYDFVNIVEAPDNDAITRVSIELGSRGTVHIMSLPAKPINDFLMMLKK
jgi:uncharacterized protein with GYD domain